LTSDLRRAFAGRISLVLTLALIASAGYGGDAPPTAPKKSAAKTAKARPPLRERLLFPLGGTRQTSATTSDGQTVPLLRFRDEIHVEAPPLDLQRLRLVWWKHWDLPGKPGSGSGTPTHKDMMEQYDELSRLSGNPMSPSVSLLPLAIAAGQALVKALSKEKMLPADPGPPYVEPLVPLEPPPAATPSPSPRASAKGAASDPPAGENAKDASAERVTE
jgi:hypothetical protein